MSDSFIETFNLHQRLRGKISVQIKEASADSQKASKFFELIITQLASCNEQNCEPETIYKNSMAIGDYWGLGSEDFKRRVSESDVTENSEDWFVRAFIGGAKISGISEDTRTAEEKAADSKKLRQLAGVKEYSISKLCALERGVRTFPPAPSGDVLTGIAGIKNLNLSDEKIGRFYWGSGTNEKFGIMGQGISREESIFTVEYHYGFSSRVTKQGDIKSSIDKSKKNKSLSASAKKTLFS